MNVYVHVHYDFKQCHLHAERCKRVKMTVHVIWGELFALVCICILAKIAISQGPICGHLWCGHKASCKRNKCKCQHRQDVSETKTINSRSVFYCVEKCRRKDPTCPVNTTCVKVDSRPKKYLCKCVAGAVQPLTGQCLVETTTPGEPSTVTDSTTSTTVTATQRTNSAALTAGLVVGLGGAILLAVIVLVVVVRKCKRKSGDGTGKTLRRPSVERQMTANAAYSNVSVSDSTGQDNAACSTAIVQTGAYEEVDLDRNSTLNNGVDGTTVMVTSKNDGTAWAMQGRHSPQNAEYTSPNEYPTLCEMKNANWNECSIQPEMNGNENTKAFQENEDSVEQNACHILCDLKTTNESESSIQPGSENQQAFQHNVNSAKQIEYQVLYDLKATKESKIQPEQNQYQVLFDLKPTDESESRIQPGNQSPNVFQEKVDSTEQNEYHILCDLKTNNDNESSIQLEITASENPEVLQPKENNSAQQSEYHILCDLKPATESENSVQPEMAGNKNPEIFQPNVHESTEQNAYHILYDVKPATENESSVQPEMTGSEYPQAFQQNVDSTAVLITDASPRGRHSPPGVAFQSRFGREEGEYDELKLPKV